MWPRCRDGPPRRGALAAVPGKDPVMQDVCRALWVPFGARRALVPLCPLAMGSCTSRHPSRGMMGCRGLSAAGGAGDGGAAQWARL